jgi:beta-phosphoglucomutase
LNLLLKSIEADVPDEEKPVLAEQKNTWYVEYIGQITKDEILPGVMSFLTDAKNSGIKTGIGSASKNTRMILERLGLINMFDSIVDGTRITHAKPDPEVFLKCSGELGIDPKHCAVFEDAAAGIEAALAAGMLAIGIGDKDILGKAHLVIPSFENYAVKDILKLSERKSV